MNEARIEGDSIVIRIPLSALPSVLEGAWAANGIYTRYRITDVNAFATDLILELNKEDETGSTPIRRLFDKCIDEAINQGAMGVEEHEDQEA